MNPRAVTSIAAQRRAELRGQAAECRRTPHRLIIPHWRVSWSRTRLSAAAEKGSSLVIIISARRIGLPGTGRERALAGQTGQVSRR